MIFSKFLKALVIQIVLYVSLSKNLSNNQSLITDDCDSRQGQQACRALSQKQDQFYNYKLPSAPIIGILTSPTKSDTSAIIPASYVKYLEAAGAVVVPVPYDLSEEGLEYFFQNLNGIMFPGGNAPLLDNGNLSLNQSASDGGDIYSQTEESSKALSQLAQAMKFFIMRSQQAAKENDHFPIFGICLGLEGIMMSLENDLSNLKYVKRVNKDSISYISGIGTQLMYIQDSPLFSEFYQNLTSLKLKLFYYHHKYGISYDNVEKYLSDQIEIYSYLTDNHEKKYITALGFKNVPIYGIQFHPEKTAYEWKISTSRSHNAMQATMKIATAFIEDCKKSKHRFNAEMFPYLVIYHFQVSDQSNYYNLLYEIPYEYHKHLSSFSQSFEQRSTNQLDTRIILGAIGISLLCLFCILRYLIKKKFFRNRIIMVEDEQGLSLGEISKKGELD